MNRLIIPLLILLVCFIPGCSLVPEQYTGLESRDVDVGERQSILVQVDHGEVTILDSEGDRAEVGGEVLYADDLEYQVNSAERQISIKVFAHRDGLSAPPLRVVLRVPKQRRVKVETGNASVYVQDYQGEVEVASTSGNIAIERMNGRLTLRSNRGNIIVRESSGVVGIAGNYGALTIENVSGETAASTIMGSIGFSGMIREGDIVRLETDHGAVFVNLSPDSALTVQVQSTSGDVACILPSISSSLRTCDGKFSSGGGALSIRTVSGAVTLKLIP